MRLITGSFILSIVSAFAFQTDCLAQQYINSPSGYTYYDTSAQTARDEAIMRQEENNRRQKKLLEEMQSENDKKIEELKKQTKESLEQLRLSNTSSDAIFNYHMQRLDQKEALNRANEEKKMLERGQENKRFFESCQAKLEKEGVVFDNKRDEEEAEVFRAKLEFEPPMLDALSSARKAGRCRVASRAIEGTAKDQVALGDMYFKGDGVPQSHEKAFEWYKKAADQNFPHAQYKLAHMYSEGLGTKKDVDAGVKYFYLAVDNGDPSAAKKLKEIRGLMTNRNASK